MPALIRRIFFVENLLPVDKRKGDIPSTASAYRQLLQIAIPSVLELVLVSLVGSIDTMMVGSLGAQAIAAVGLVGQPRMLILCVFFALNIGVTAVVARRKGEGRQDTANEALRTALVVIMALSVLVTAIALPLAKPLMWLAGAKEDTVELATQYFSIITLVLPLNALTLCINAAQRGVGNTRVTMYVNILSNVVNIIFNYLLIGGNLGFPKMGVAGAALATLIGFVAGFIFSVFSVASHKSAGRFLHISIHDRWMPRMDSFRAIAKVGGNAMLEQIALRIGFFIYARLVADLGTNPLAAHHICMQFLNLSFSFADGLGVAGTSLVGQMMGKDRPDLSMMYGKIAQRVAMVMALCLASLILLLRYPMVRLFSSEADVVALAAQVMIIVAAFQPLQTSSVVISGCLRGAGDTRYVATIMLICVAVLRPILAFTGIHILGLGLVGAWCASLIDMTVRLTCVYRRFAGGKWFTIKV